MKIVTIVGARPQFVKAAALSRELTKHTNIEEVILHTGQHFDKNMSDIFFSEMKIPTPKYNLKINSLSHGAMTARMLEAIEKILKKENPDFLLVYGDTNSTIAGALAAVKLNINVVHVESGLRSFNMNMPEEINRIITDRLSKILFCPTKVSMQNLMNEGYKNFDKKIVNVGDIMLDAALFYEKISDEKSSIIKKFALQKSSYLLATIHRQENTNNQLRFNEIFHALNELSKKIKIILPVHPRIKQKLDAFSLNNNFIITEPVGYFDMISLIKNSRFVITDSGGLQKEAYFFKKFCITIRDQTEWIELVKNNYNILVSSNPKKIFKAVDYFFDKKFNDNNSFYGNGNTAKKIVDFLIKFKKK